MPDKMALSAYILKIVEKDPFLRLQMRVKEDFNRHQLFFPQISNTYLQNETNRWSIFSVKTKYW